MKDIDLRDPTSFLDHVCLGCTQRECNISNYRDLFESRISAGGIEKSEANISSGSYDMEGHAMKCVERYC